MRECAISFLSFRPLRHTNTQFARTKVTIQELGKLKFDWGSKIPLEMETIWIK